jgi:hypothetical protein
MNKTEVVMKASLSVGSVARCSRFTTVESFAKAAYPQKQKLNFKGQIHNITFKIELV